MTAGRPKRFSGTTSTAFPPDVVLDTSALVAILLSEPEAPALIAALAAADRRMVGAPTLVEAGAVMLARKGPPGELALDALLQRLEIAVVEMSPAAAAAARTAYARWGKGVGTPGVLNFGDCLSYGVAAELGERLLFKGDDFTHTDIQPAL